MLLPIHIAAGGLAIVLGAVALSANKGGMIHRRSGLLFVYAMLVMGISASILAFRKSPSDGNVLAGFMTAYFVGTALTTVRPVSPWTRRINVAALAVPVGCAFIDIVGGVKAFNSPDGVLNGVLFLISSSSPPSCSRRRSATCASCGSACLAAGRALARHLWRMCFALFIAAGSFFSIRERVAKILPEPFTTAPMRTLPILLLFGAKFYWLWKVRSCRTLPVLVRHDSVALLTSQPTARHG
jgi:predicted membrane protein DUF2306